MKYFVILFGFLILLGFTGTVFAQSIDDTYDDKSGTLVATTNNVRYNVPYLITSGTVNEITLLCDSASAIVLFTSDKSGELILDIPRSMLDARYNDTDNEFFVLLDGEEINFEETSHVNSREITIQFDPGSYDLEIISAWGIISLDIEKFACKVIHNPPYSYILPPLKQFKSGVAIDEIQCKESLTLVKKYDGSHACVKPETIPKLIERGWTSEGSVCLGGPGTKFDENCVRIKN